MLSAKKAPAGILRELFYNIFKKKACGHIKGALLQHIKKRPLREYLVSPFDILINRYILLLNYYVIILYVFVFFHNFMYFYSFIYFL